MASKSEVEDVELNGDGEGEVENGKRSYHIAASVLRVLPDGTKAHVLTFRPSGRGDDSADAMIAAKKQYAPAGKVTNVTLRNVEVDLGNGLELFIAWRRSGANCPTCGASRQDGPTSWCHDAKGCEAYRKPENKEVTKRTSVDEAALLAKLNATFGD